ncbi:peroxisomal membrane anchor protein conserved region-domain-containing protein [Radiomyces spectabilis]|uniref:peroxisomal membrane anchor protein conserved region-domain-containing protein n=1 Tax=Radiomyces spectabilis TaxID=64574 RepID=UPI00221FFFFA|nr:peroxisomal membrane anchor protein conserved region-domain-containing protein [Radiomyces spectabilis]KAI8365365.1 peroxisomal membrane anchor protein conserved region-domain-containing protein [Radiomyces spectabilis]
MREDMIKSAVSFLSDPKVQSAALAKKVSFLESKGMTSEEIEEAMSRVSGKSTGASTAVTTTAAPGGTPGAVTTTVPGGMVVQTAPPPVPQRLSYDWRDVFIAAVLAGGVSYGVWTLAKKLFGPWFKVPTQKELEEDKEKLDAQFQAVEDSLKDIKDQTNEALTTVSSQSKKVEESLESLEGVLKDLKEGDASRDKEFEKVKGDVDSLKELVPKMLDRNKEAQAAILNDLQNEIKSLKSLMLSRRPTTPGSSLLEQGSSSNPIQSPSTPGASTDGLSPRLAATLNAGNRPGIPAWQMAAASKANATASSEANKPAESTESAEAA